MYYYEDDGECYFNINPSENDNFVFGVDVFSMVTIVFDADTNKMAFWPLSEYTFVEEVVVQNTSSQNDTQN